MKIKMSNKNFFKRYIYIYIYIYVHEQQAFVFCYYICGYYDVLTTSAIES